jgi:hypothetical protein
VVSTLASQAKAKVELEAWHEVAEMSLLREDHLPAFLTAEQRKRRRRAIMEWYRGYGEVRRERLQDRPDVPREPSHHPHSALGRSPVR